MRSMRRCENTQVSVMPPTPPTRQCASSSLWVQSFQRGHGTPASRQDCTRSAQFEGVDRSRKDLRAYPLESRRSRRKPQVIGKKAWCERGDSNPHPLRDQILSLARLPIPPLSQIDSSLQINSLCRRPCPVPCRWLAGVPESVPGEIWVCSAPCTSRSCLLAACRSFISSTCAASLEGASARSQSLTMISVEHRPRFVTGVCHCNSLRYAGSHQTPYPRLGRVMEDARG